MRITALYTDDREMLEMFLTGQDIHKNTASIMYNKKMEDVTAEERQASKAVAFGLIDRKSTRLNSSHQWKSRMPSSA